MLVMLSVKDYFKSKRLLFGMIVGQILLYTGFNIFNIYRLELPDGSYLVLNARYSDYVSIFFVDIVLIAVLMFMLLVLRQAELHVLVKLGVYKNVEDLTDKEIISEYNKLKKQSNKLQKKINSKKKANNNNNGDARQRVSG